MPEGDTVWRAARTLDRALAGQALTRTDFRVPQLATADLAGGTVLQTASRGKHLLTRIDAQEHWTLHTHLKMEGAWQVYEPGQRWRRPAHEARVVLQTARRTAVGFSLGVVELIPRDAESERRRAPGPGPAGRRLGRRRGGPAPAGHTRARRPRGAARPDLPRRDREPLRQRALLHQRRPPPHPGRRRGRPAAAGPAGAADARAEQAARPADHHRRPARAARGSTAATRASAAGAVRRSRSTSAGPTGGSGRRTGARCQVTPQG